jgi:hypothetical protein
MATVNLKLGIGTDGKATNQIDGVILQPGDVIVFDPAGGQTVLADVTKHDKVELEVGENPLPASEIRAIVTPDGNFLITFGNPGGGGTPPTGGGN